MSVLSKHAPMSVHDNITLKGIIVQVIEEINGVKSRDYEVMINERTYAVTLASGCLLEPAEQDICMVYFDEQHQGWITSVLIQQDPSIQILKHYGDLLLMAKGDLHFKGKDIVSDAHESVSMSNKDMYVYSQRIKFKSDLALATTERTQLSIRSLHLNVCGKAESVVQSLKQVLQKSFRTIRDHDEKQSESAYHHVDGNIEVHADNSMTYGKDNMVLEAEKIHLG
ncbi:DUF3540 domain-containing protein [Shewanella surugensis]|uniref:DUF3540 domain-containing protein n=1 Tax=Shewanella surugensis TaxID=212020 RepID=A0ABT0LE47_9GAMM|nr:DUF3540 domain-containing protein [Shewanella surugensis]MCL1125977.1 DUF3540 domain-containing protein [Shewanella surugensis]